MKDWVIIPKEIITADAKRPVIKGGALVIQNGIIAKIYEEGEWKSENLKGRVLNVPNLTLIPGFIQTHVHLCQTLFRGMADDMELLDWLQKRIFPLENAHTKSSLRISARLGIYELLTGGTTTIMDMGTIRHQEIIFEELIKSGLRAFAGKCMVDVNSLFPNFQESTKDALTSSYQLAKEFHNKEAGRIKYAFAPRFVLSCSEELLKETMNYVQDFEGAMFHTHSSENKNEIEEVKKLTGKENIEYFKSIGVLSHKTLLAHGIHVSEEEVTMLKETKARIAHCPSSNLKLGSGIANIPRYIQEGVNVSLGADGAPCNNNLSMFTEMRLASLIQKPLHSSTSMNARDTFYLATIEGAKALHIDDITGSIEENKRADLVLLDLESPTMNYFDSPSSAYSNIVYSAGRENVKYVFVDGEMLVNKGVSLSYDPAELYSKAKEELSNLLINTNLK